MFLYQQIFEDLKSKILLEKYSYGDLLPAERQLEEDYGVDRTTIRKAMQLLVYEGLIDKKIGRGTQIIYSSKMKEEESIIGSEEKRVILFLFPESDKSNRITIPFYSELFHSLEADCKKMEYFLVYSTIKSKDKLENVFSHIKQRIAGVVFVSDIEEKHILEARSLRIPSVLVNGYSSHLPSVLSDNFTGTYLGTSYLLKKGHAKIAVLNGVKSYNTALERLRGVKTALKESNLKLQDEDILGGNSWEYSEAYNSVLDFLKNKSEDYPTAIIAFNDRLAMGAIGAINELGLKVPEDISVIGFDNSEQAKTAYPKLTTIDVNIPNLARVAFSTLYTQINLEQLSGYQILMPVNLVERDSVKKIVPVENN